MEAKGKINKKENITRKIEIKLKTKTKMDKARKGMG